MPRAPKADTAIANIWNDGDFGDQSPPPVATFRPSPPRTDEWAHRRDRPELIELDLIEFQRSLEAMLSAAGLPGGCVANVRSTPAACKVHLGHVRLDLRDGDRHVIQITHCGCDDWRAPVADPPRDLPEMARNLAEEIIWYWHNSGDFMVMDPEIAAACEREAAKDRSQGLATTFAGPKAIEFETFRGRDQSAVAYIDMLHDSLLRQRWRRYFHSVADATRFFRAMRPYLRSLAVRRDEYAEAGADGAIDRLALASLEHLGINPLPVIADLAATGVCKQFHIGGARLLLCWHFKMIKGVLLMPPGVDWPFGKIHTIRDQDRDRVIAGHEGISAILSSPLLPDDTSLKRERRCPDWIEMHDPISDLFAVLDGVARWVRREDPPK